MSTDASGLPPNSREHARNVLESLRAARDAPPGQGPLSDGLAPTNRIVIASFVDPACCRLFQQRLLHAGVMSSTSVSRRRWRVEVDAEDRSSALGLLDAHLSEHPDRRPAGMRRDHDYLILGSCVGVGLSFVMTAATFGNASMGGRQLVVAALACTAWGALAGTLMDVARHSRRDAGRIQFGMWPLLLSFTVLILTGFLLSMF